MDELIGQITSQLNMETDKAETGVGALLSIIKEKAADGDAAALLGALPGSEDLISKASALASDGAGAGGGLLGGLMSKVSTLMGGSSTGEIMGMLSKFQGAGIGMDDVKGMAPMLIGFAKEKAGPELVDKIIGQVPGLDKLL